MPEVPPGGARKPLFDRVLELAVYAPLGAALRIAEQVPDLASAGREIAGRQVDNARVVGRYAVGAVRRQLERPVPRAPAGGGDRAAPPPFEREPASRSEEEAVAPRHRAARVAAEPAPGEENLAVPGYDALAASQVLPLLRGLSPTELEAVRRHEAANRARRTVLGRIAQLQEERGDERR